jgi:predicted dehydrogenase
MVEINTTTTRPLARWHIDGTQGSASSPHSPTFDTKVWADLQFTPAKESESARVFPVAAPGLSETQIWDAFAKAVRGEGHPAVKAESVLPTMLLLDAARESSRQGRAIVVGDKVGWVL